MTGDQSGDRFAWTAPTGHRSLVTLLVRSQRMDFSFTEDQEALRQLARTDLRRPLHARAPEGDRGDAGVVRPHAVGRAGESEPARRRVAGGRRRQRARLLRAVHPARGAVGRAVAPVPALADAGARRAARRPLRLRSAAPALSTRRVQPARQSSARRWSRTAATSPARSPRRHGATAATGASTA